MNIYLLLVVLSLVNVGELLDMGRYVLVNRRCFWIYGILGALFVLLEIEVIRTCGAFKAASAAVADAAPAASSVSAQTWFSSFGLLLSGNSDWVADLNVQAGAGQIWSPDLVQRLALKLYLSAGLMAAGFQDVKTMYFSAGWIILLIFMVPAGFVCFQSGSGFDLWMYVPGLCFCLILPLFVWRRVLGIADVWVMAAMACCLPAQTFLKTLMLATGMGIIQGLTSRKSVIPFISMLAVACMILLVSSGLP